MDKSNNIIGSRILELRTRAGEKQEELAQVIHCNRGSLSNYEKGARTPDAYTIALIAKHYNITSDYLLGLTDTPSTNRDIAFISDYTGLDEDIIESLHKHNSRPSGVNAKSFSVITRSEFSRLNRNCEMLSHEVEILRKRMHDEHLKELERGISRNDEITLEYVSDSGSSYTMTGSYQEIIDAMHKLTSTIQQIKDGESDVNNSEEE